MDTARIATLLEPFLLHPLSPTQLGNISTYIDLLLRWNARTNLTAIRNPDDIVTRHFGESLFAAQTLFPATTHVGTAALGRWADRSSAEDPSRTLTPDDPPLSPTFVIPTEGRNLLFDGGAQPSAGSAEGTADNSPPVQRRDLPPQTTPLSGTPETSPALAAPPRTLDLLDLGSGAGFPGIPIHLWAPNLQTTLVESQQKKVAFLREVIRALTLTDINVSPARAEDHPSTARLVTLRAVERFDQILPTASRLLAPQSRLALLIAEPQASTARRLLPHFSWHPPIPIPRSSARILLVGTSS